MNIQIDCTVSVEYMGIFCTEHSFGIFSTVTVQWYFQYTMYNHYGIFSTVQWYFQYCIMVFSALQWYFQYFTMVFSARYNGIFRTELWYIRYSNCKSCKLSFSVQ